LVYSDLGDATISINLTPRPLPEGNPCELPLPSSHYKWQSVIKGVVGEYIGENVTFTKGYRLSRELIWYAITNQP
jgi:hypothetical protein